MDSRANSCRSQLAMLCLGLAIRGASAAEYLPPPGDKGAQDPRASAMLDALEAYDNSIEALSWEETTYLPPCTTWNRNEWTTLEESSRYFGPGGGWFIRNSMMMVDPPEYKPEYYGATYVAAGSFRVTWTAHWPGAKPNQGMLTQVDGFQGMGTHLDCAMGRCFDFVNKLSPRPSSIILRDAERLIYLEPIEDEPWPGLRAENALAPRLWAHFEVRLDPAHDMAPCLIRLVRPNDGLDSDTTVILEFARVNEVWIPAVGIRSSRYAQIVQSVDNPLSPDRLEDFKLARSMVGLPEATRTPAMARWIERMQGVSVLNREERRVAGPFVCFDKGESTGSPQVFAVRSVKVNRTIAPEAFLGNIPEDARMFNGVIGEWGTLAEIRRSFLELVGPSAPSWDLPH